MREIPRSQPDRRTRTRPASSKTRYAESFYEVAHDMITAIRTGSTSNAGHSDAARPAGMGAAARVPGTPSLHGVSCAIATVPARDPTSP
jgi:hypothetical protein